MVRPTISLSPGPILLLNQVLEESHPERGKMPSNFSNIMCRTELPTMKTLTAQEFRGKAIRRGFLVLCLLVLVNLFGTLGIYLLEDASLMDSFYMAVITLTTVGFREVIPLSDQGRIFAILLIYVGLVTSGLSVALLMDLLFQETMIDLFKGKKMEKRLLQFEGHFVVCGYGTTGEGLVKELLAEGESVVIVDLQELPVHPNPRCLAIQGDARKDNVLKQAGINRAAGLASTLTEDADNVFVILTARALNPKLKLASRFKDDDTENKLIKAGVDHAVSPYRMGGNRLALALTNPGFLEILDASLKKSDLKVRFIRIEVPEGSRVCGKLMKESKIKDHSLGALVVAVIDRYGDSVFNPPGEFRLDHAKHLLILGNDEQAASLKAFLKPVG